MPSLPEIERELACSIASPVAFANAVDSLLTHLLDERTDGVLLELFHAEKRAVVASGIVYRIEQSVHPLRIELEFDEHGAIVSGALFFDDASRSWTHARLSREILAYPRRDFPWKHAWRLP
ncbi:MAG: hypothetical protein JOZ54_10960 [Acidobacteria bacterium]|nr:hypothetical protein [Acidobacteriota bacterium]